MELAETSAAMRFMPQTSKYVFELAMVFGALVIGALQFTLESATHAVATLGVFLVAGARIAPAMMRIQQGAIGIKSNIGVANPTLELIESMREMSSISPVEDSLDLKHMGFESSVALKNVGFSYPKTDRKTLKNISLEIPPGTKVAFVGSSGSGKTTLVDIILGILRPDSGSVLISGVSPVDAIRMWPGSIGYVPQDVVLSHGTIRENIALGFPESLISSELIWKALERAQLAEFVRALPNGIETSTGERGSKLSGGQRQRIGIARALVTNPKLLVLDEATSALDGVTESELTKTFLNSSFGITTIVVAHRLSTIKDADLICFVKNGEILASGDFETLKRLVPDFSDQAELMGL
jgi:ABC-type multidrug transport system fused ATPase/permease subunit